MLSIRAMTNEWISRSNITETHDCMSYKMLNTKNGICIKCQAFIPFECNQFSRIKIIYGIWKILRSQTTSILNFELFATYQDFIIITCSYAACIPNRNEHTATVFHYMIFVCWWNAVIWVVNKHFSNEWERNS